MSPINKILFLVIMIAEVMTLNPEARAEPEHPTLNGTNHTGATLDGIKWSAGFATLRNGYEGVFGFVTPHFLQYAGNLSELAAFLDVGSITLTDSFTSGGKLRDTQNAQVALGVRSTDRISDFVQGYVGVGLNYINFDSRLANLDGSTSSFGLLLKFGGDIMFQAKAPVGLGAKDESVYVEADWRSGHKRLDSLAGQPGPFNGIGINFGYRMHY
jgi:hypothetical protein